MTTTTPDAPAAKQARSAKGRAGRKGAKRPATSWRKAIRRDWQIYSLAVAPLLFFLVFRYTPMIGNVIAFRFYQPGGPIFGTQWVGFYYFLQVFHDPNFWAVFQNTVILGLLALVIGFPLPIVLALLLNEVINNKAKGFVQAVSYLPHFLSVVTVAALMLNGLTSLGIVDEVLHWFGVSPILFLQDPGWFRTIYVSSEVWQYTGWGTILYLAALTTIDPQLYEAAMIDGSGRWKQTWHVTLPGIRPMMMVVLTLNVGNFMAVGFEKILLIYNPLTYPTADVISTYLYRVGIQTGNFSYAACVGLFESVIGLTLVLSTNAISRRVVGTSLW
jgi:putative aldouronate transport system permease protein